MLMQSHIRCLEIGGFNLAQKVMQYLNSVINAKVKHGFIIHNIM